MKVEHSGAVIQPWQAMKGANLKVIVKPESYITDEQLARCSEAFRNLLHRKATEEDLKYLGNYGGNLLKEIKEQHKTIATLREQAAKKDGDNGNRSKQ